MGLFRTTYAPGTYVLVTGGYVYPVEHYTRSGYVLRGDPDYLLWQQDDLIPVDHPPLYGMGSLVVHEGRQYTVAGIQWVRGGYQYQLTAIVLSASANERNLSPVDL